MQIDPGLSEGWLDASETRLSVPAVKPQVGDDLIAAAITGADLDALRAALPAGSAAVLAVFARVDAEWAGRIGADPAAAKLLYASMRRHLGVP